MATKKRKAVAKADPRQAYINRMVGERGYVLDYHKVMVKHDLEAMDGINAFVEAVYLKRRHLDRRTRELICIVGLVLSRARAAQIQSHMRLALDAGVSKAELLEAVELVIGMGGFVPFQEGLKAWCEVTGATGIEPTAEGYEG